MPANTLHTFPHIISSIFLMENLAHMQVWECGENSAQVTPRGGRVETLHLADDRASAFLSDSVWVTRSYYQHTALGFISSSLAC